MLLGAILAITGLTSAQSSAPVSRATFFYEVTNQGDYSWNVAPAAPWPSSLLVQFASSETKQEHGTSYAIGEITEFNEYLGAFGTIIPMSDGIHYLHITYPHSLSVLSLTVTITNKTIVALEGSYSAKCGGRISEWNNYHLTKSLNAILKRGMNTVSGTATVDLPNPKNRERDPSHPHPKVTSGLCLDSTVLPQLSGLARYYDLKVTTIPKGASVYVSSEFLGVADKSLIVKVRYSPAYLLVRLPGYLDVAKSLTLQHGPNEVTVVLAATKP